MTGAGNRRKGHDAERALARWARAHGCPDAVTTRNTGGAGGRQVGDVILAPGVVVEVKCVKASAWPTWCRQAHTAAGERLWAVVRKTPGVTDPALWSTVTPIGPMMFDLSARDDLQLMHVVGLPPLVRFPFHAFVDAVRVDR